MLFNRFFSTAAVVTVLFLSHAAYSQFIFDIESRASTGEVKVIRERGVEMLDEIKSVLKLRYFDKNYRGIDIDTSFKRAKEKVKTLDNHSDVFKTIAQVLLEFNDSHTMFYPPGRAHRIEYGFTMQHIGDDVVVTDIKKGSDAETKGLKVGDVLKKIGMHALDRQNLKLISYYIYNLEPQSRLRLLVQTADNSEREIVVIPTVKTLQDRLKEEKEAEARRRKRAEAPYRCKEVSPALISCRLETFRTDRRSIEKMMSEVQKYPKLILDLRGNRGGYVSIEEYLLGHFFDREVKIADIVTRSGKKERFVKPRKDRAFQGELIVLIDSRSASASEMFARVTQLERRAKIVGDISAGAVMTSNSVGLSQRHSGTYVFYTLNVTIADVIMSDGNRLEHHGVIPDYPVGPTREALSSASDPVLSYAASLLKVKLSSADAGKFYFLSKAPEVDDDDGDEEEPKEPAKPAA